MSKIKIQGSSSGTGTLTIQAPTTSTDRTLNIPDSSGTLLDENSSVPAANLTGTVADARISALTASKLTGALPAISGASLTNLPDGGKLLKAAFTNTLQKTGNWTDTSEHTILSLSYTPVSATSTLYITNNLTFQLYGNGNGVNLEIQIHTKEDGATILDGRDLHWNTYATSDQVHFTPSHTASITRPSTNTNARTFTVTLKNEIGNRRIQIGSYYPRFLQILEVEA